MKICVYAGSFTGVQEEYSEAAVRLGAEIAVRDELVYGGAEVGLMGVVADAVLAGGASVTGVVPRSLLEYEAPHPRLTELILTDTISIRKQKMAELSDAFVAIPGGIGTMEEWFEVWTASQLGISPKAVGLLNTLGYYDRLLGFLEHMVGEGFLQQAYVTSLVVAESPVELVAGLRNWTRPPAKWTTEEAHRLASGEGGMLVKPPSSAGADADGTRAGTDS